MYRSLFNMLHCYYRHNVCLQTLDDKPQYQYRGLMIDTARHFLPVATIFTVIEGMALEKLNMLHWHAVDDQSFPLEVLSLPRLKRAAFHPALIYSVADITAVVAYARSYGIRVMLELDTPGWTYLATCPPLQVMLVRGS